MKLGIVGLPNVGKSTLFNALTSTQNAQAANYPFCTIEPNSGIVPVPDPRLDKLAEIWQTDKKTPAIVEFVDIAGLVKGASQGAGLGNKFLGHIRECDAIVHVVRCFDDDNIIHVVEDVNKPESVDPIRDIDAIDLELILAQAIPICAKTEEDIAGSTQEEKIAFLQEMGIESTGLDKLIKASYELLGLISFLTDGKKECRAWTIRKGTKAPQAAGKIHSDFERGFIRAQVIAYKDLEDADFNYAAVKAKGLQRTEGKEYVVNDGDVIEFLFNV